MSSENKFDLRNIERNMRRGKVSKEEYEAYLSSLEDCSDDAEECETRFLHKSKKEEEQREEQQEE